MRQPTLIERSLIRVAASAFSRSGPSASLLVLIYHRVPPEPDALLPSEPHATQFQCEVEALQASFNVMPLADAAVRLREGRLGSRSACITFDDGYASNHDVAMPILKARGVPATVFVATGYLNGGCMFNDSIIEMIRGANHEIDLRAEGLGQLPLPDDTARLAAIRKLLGHIKYLEPAARKERIAQLLHASRTQLPVNLMMTDGQVRAMHDTGFEIGAHTIDHPILTTVDDTYARDQIVGSKAKLESIIGTRVRGFAYPNGQPTRDYGVRHARMARDAGFDYACSTAYGAAIAGSDPFQIPRVSPVACPPLQFGLRLARVLHHRNATVAS